MHLSPHHWDELAKFSRFTTLCLSPQQKRVLHLLATQDLFYKDVAHIIKRDVKTVEKHVGNITERYRDFYGAHEQNASFRYILCRAASYYFCKDAFDQEF
jgi:DNA-binding CsgD family transcriptional regulator